MPIRGSLKPAAPILQIISLFWTANSVEERLDCCSLVKVLFKSPLQEVNKCVMLMATSIEQLLVLGLGAIEEGEKREHRALKKEATFGTYIVPIKALPSI